jgi:hypothetical protein
LGKPARARKSVGGEITNFGGKSKKGFLAVTLVTVLSILAVIAVYAVLIGTFNGGQVTVQGPSFSTTIVTYSTDNATWNTALNITTSTAWYARLEVAGGYTGPVTITWQLQQENSDSSWSNVNGASATTSTFVPLTGAAQYVYASSNGLSGNNYDWGSVATTGGTYRVSVTVNSA